MDRFFDVIKRFFYASLGVGGMNLSVGNTSTHNGTWCAVQVLEAAVINTIEIDGAADSVIASVSSHAAGTIIYGRITSIRLTSGKVRLYGYLPV